jgi:hypothetical protein
MFANGGDIAVKALQNPANGDRSAGISIRGNRGRQAMGGIGDKAKDGKPVKTDEPPKKPPPKVNEDDDFEDGDIATPKRDRDDEQQGL